MSEVRLVENTYATRNIIHVTFLPLFYCLRYTLSAAAAAKEEAVKQKDDDNDGTITL